MRINYQSQRAGPVQFNAVTEDEFIIARSPPFLSRFGQPENISWKFVLKSDPSVIVAYVIFAPPQPKDSRTKAQKAEDIRTELNSWNDPRTPEQKEDIVRLKVEDIGLNEEFLGTDHGSRYWDLKVLATDAAHQRKGLATMLVRKGLDQITENYAALSTEDKEGILGVTVIASPQGAKTYENCGFVKRGEKIIHDGYVQRWYVRAIGEPALEKNRNKDKEEKD